jgi:hypothetical protein
VAKGIGRGIRKRAESSCHAILYHGYYGCEDGFTSDLNVVPVDVETFSLDCPSAGVS